MDDFVVTGSNGMGDDARFCVVDSKGREVERPGTAPPKFRTKGSGGGGGAGGGVGGLGGRHAAHRPNDTLPRTQLPIASEAARYVATRPPTSTAAPLHLVFLFLAKPGLIPSSSPDCAA